MNETLKVLKERRSVRKPVREPIAIQLAYIWEKMPDSSSALSNDSPWRIFS